ncbi:rubredoxin [Streptomyces sp. SID11385]|uniref:rubredoxin n=1 Tax=Streptomyces sp. SID11385 TaxID=2706031 RepID=UPI001944ED50|nr:rubredoxin [Streptomyces sp. SID11385]
MAGQKHLCLLCGYVYEQAQGAPESGISPGTAWIDVPMQWRCPECGAAREDFEEVLMD